MFRRSDTLGLASPGCAGGTDGPAGAARAQPWGPGAPSLCPAPACAAEQRAGRAAGRPDRHCTSPGGCCGDWPQVCVQLSRDTPTVPGGSIKCPKGKSGSVFTSRQSAVPHLVTRNTTNSCSRAAGRLHPAPVGQALPPGFGEVSVS